MRLTLQSKHESVNSRTAGFTLLEILIVVFIIGTLAAVGIPSWLSLINAMRLKTAQAQVYSVMQEAKSKAKQQKITYQASFRDVNNMAQWSVHPASVTPSETQWQSLNSRIKIDAPETTLYQSPITASWRMQFNYKGHANGQLGRLTVSNRNGSSTKKRCVYVSTLLGAMRTAKERATPQNGRSCY